MRLAGVGGLVGRRLLFRRGLWKERREDSEAKASS